MNITSFLITNLINGLVGIVLLILGYVIFDKITPRSDFDEIFSSKTFNGGSIIVAAFILGLAIVIGKATM
jgi:uncharacterized membrane protein YjfL (UPF0719 family)